MNPIEVMKEAILKRHPKLPWIKSVKAKLMGVTEGLSTQTNFVGNHVFKVSYVSVFIDGKNYFKRWENE
jgi:hypothetical protein